MVLESNTLDVLFVKDGQQGEDGKILYTWIKYAKDASGTGMTDDPNGAVYIGISYNNESSIESNDPTQYAWTKIQGADGKKGEDAYTIFLENENISFATDENRDPLSEQAYTSGITIMKGAKPVTDFTIGDIAKTQGIAVAKTNTAIAISVVNGNPLPNDSGEIEIPITVGGTVFKKILTWTCAKKGDQGEKGEQGIQGPQGEQGIAGKDGTSVTITNKSITYQLSTSGTTIPTGTWQTTPQAIPEGQYQWTKTSVTYSDGNKTESYSISYHGKNGSNGTSVKTTSTSVKYQVGDSGTTKPTGTWQSNVPTVAQGKYLWTQTIVNYSDGNSTESYSVSYKGIDGSNGVNGMNAATIYLYQRATSTPSKPSNALTYTFSTTKITGTLNNGWSTTIPTGTDAVYVTVASVSSKNDTTTIATSAWSAPVVLAQNGKTGSDGKAGLNVATIYLYQRNTSKPSKPSASVTYTFSTGVASGLNNRWSQKIPDGTNPLYVTLATASSNTATDTILSSEWSDVVVMAQNGEDGISPKVSLSKTGDTTTISIIDATGTHTQTVKDGTNGTPGVAGKDGKTSYFHVKYSNDGGKTFTGNSGEDTGIYMGSYTDYTEADSTDVKKYNWVKVSGDNFSWNLINNGKGDVKKGFFKNFSSVNATEKYVEITLTSKHHYIGIDLPGFVLNPRQYEVGEKVTWSYDIMYTKWDFPTGSNRQEYWMGQRYTGAPSGETATGQWVGVTSHNLPVVGQNGCELNKWFHVEVTKTIPTPASSNVGYQECINFYNSTDIPATVTLRMKNVKLEYGDTATPWSPSQSDLEGRGVSETVQYYLATSQASGVTSSTSGWSTDITTQKLTADKKYLWNCYQTKYSDGTSEPISTPKVIGVYGDKGDNAKNLSITPSSQYFKSTDGGKTFAPDTITIKPTIQGEINFGKWQYSIDGGVSFADVVSEQKGLTVSNNVLTVSKDSSLYSDAVTMITFRAVADDSSFYDTCSIAKIYDVTDIGDGRNLLTGVSSYTKDAPFEKTDSRADGWIVYQNIITSIELEAGKKYVLQAKTDGNWTANHDTNGQDPSKKLVTLWLCSDTTNDFFDMRQGYVVFTPTVTAKYKLRVNQYSNGTDAYTIHLWDIKLEKGSSPTGWTPAPEDLQTAILSTKSEISDVSLKVDKNKQAIEQRVEKTTYEQDLNLVKGDISKANEGLNKWRYEIYPKSLFASEYQGKSTMDVFAKNTNLTPSQSVLINDTDLSIAWNYAENYIGYALTFAKFSAAKSVAITFAHDDGAHIYLNGKLIGGNDVYNNKGESLTLGFVKGWNCIEVVVNEGANTEGFKLGTTISALSECQLMNCYYGTPVARQSHITNQLVENTTNIKGVTTTMQKVMTTVGGSDRIDEFVNNYNKTIESEKQFKKTIGETYTTKDEFNGLEIGGRNLLTKDDCNMSKWQNLYPVHCKVTNNDYSNHIDYVPTSGEWEIVYKKISITKGQKYILSFDYKVNKAYNYLSGQKYGVYLSTSIPTNAAPINIITDGQYVIENTVTSLKRGVITFTAPIDTLYIVINGGCIDDNQTGLSFEFNKWKLEKGNKATDWTPAPEDNEINGQNLVSNLPSNWEQGGINGGQAVGSTYASIKSSTTYRIRIKDIFSVSGNIAVSAGGTTTNSAKETLSFYGTLYDAKKGLLRETGWKSFPSTINCGDAKYMSIILRWGDGTKTQITPPDISQICLKIERGTSATPFTLAPEDVNGKIVNVETIANQTADKFSWIVKSGTSSSNFEITDRLMNLVSANINLDGIVSFMNTAKGDGRKNLYNLDYSSFENVASQEDAICYAKDNGVTSVGIDSSVSYDGDKSLKISYTTANLNSSTTPLYLGSSANNYGCVKIQAGKQYILSCYVKSDSTTGLFMIDIQGHDTPDTKTDGLYLSNIDPRKLPGSSTGVNLSTDWQRAVCAIKVADNATGLYWSVVPLIWGRPSSSSAPQTFNVWVDCIMLEEVDSISNEPGTYIFDKETIIDGGSIKTDTITGNQILAGSITADKIATDAIKSHNYISSGGTQGSFLNLGDGSFTSPNLSWDANGNLIAKNANLSGEITATNGSIAGWTIISNKMYTTGSGKYTGIGKYGSAYAFWAGATSNDNGNSAVFKVGHTGKLTATDADITGTITATNGKIGRYDITSTYLMTNSGSNASGIGGNQAFWAGAEDSNSAPFRVGYDGVLWAENAAIRGSIETGNLGDEGDTVSIINGHIGIQGTSNNVEIYSTGFKFGIDGDYYLMSVSEGVKCYRNLYATDFVADGWLYCSEVHSSGAVVIGADSESFYWAHGYQIARGTSWGGVCVGDDSQQLRLYGSSIWASHSISTSDENLKENFTTLDQYENFYMNLNPIGFNYIGDYDGKKTHFGFGAHKTEDVLESEGYDADKFAVVTHRPLVQEDIEKRFGKDVEVDIETEYGVSYTEFIALNTHMIQKTRRELTKVKQEKADLEVRLQAIEAKLGL